MTSKERVTAAISRLPVDRVPLGFYAVDCDTVEAVLGRPTYVRNKIAIQVALWEGRRAEVVESLKTDTVEFYRKIDCADLILPKEAQALPPRDYTPDPPRRMGENLWEDREGRVYQAEPATNEIRCVHDPVQDRKVFSEADFQGPVSVSPPGAGVYEVVHHVREQLGTDRYVAGLTGGISVMPLLGGTEQGLMRYLLEPDLVRAAGRQAVLRQSAMDAFVIEPEAPGVLMEEDLAGTTGPLISPAMFRDFCLPWLRERIASVRRYTPQVLFHSCGRTLPILDMIVDAGIDCYQSLQTTAGMEIGMLQKTYGDRVAFWGGVPVEDLIMGTPDDVRRSVRRAMEACADSPGFVLGPSHSVAKGTRYANFMAMLDEYVHLRDRY